MKKILIVTEANEIVASGHLFECIICKKELEKEGFNVDLMINADMLYTFKQRIESDYYEYESNIQEEINILFDHLKTNTYDILLFNLREIQNQFVGQIRQLDDLKIWCIDEFGNRKLDVDVIINPMIDNYYWNYKTEARIYCGAQYLVLDKKISEFHAKEKKINQVIQNVTISMGGVDVPGTTVKLVEWIGKEMGDVQLNVVLGGGFLWKEKLLSVVRDHKNIKVFENISFLHEIFYASDVAVCAGGNTLHELAAIGVPTLVIPSMPHEVRNALAFQKQGFSFYCGDADTVCGDSFNDKLRMIKKYSVRKNMSDHGKKIADGKGYQRICELIKIFI